MKKLFVYLFLLCFSLYSNAQATDLTIDNQTPGWLSSKINYGDQQTVKNLKVTGYINNTDIRFIGSLTQLSLNGVIDLGDVTIVGDSWNGHFKSPSSATSTYVTEDYSYSIQKLILPHNLTSYLEPERSFSQSSVDTLVFDTQVNKIGNYTLKGYGDVSNVQSTFRRTIGDLILGENVDSLMYLPSDYPQTVHLPKSLKFIGHFACQRRGDLSKWNIKEFPNLEEVGYCAFTYSGPGHMIPETINNSTTLPDSIFFPSIETFNMSSFDYKEGMHVFFGDKLKKIFQDNSVAYTYNFRSRCENVSFHFSTMSPPEVLGMYYCSSSCKIYVPKGAKSTYESVLSESQPHLSIIIEEAQPLENIILGEENTLMEVGEKIILTATPVPENADDINMIWSVDKPEVISVTQNGVVEALSSGIAIITVSSSDGTIKATCTVCVKTHASSIAINPSEVTFTKLGTMEQLQAVVLPEETFDKSVKWTSSNSSVCTVTSTGKIVAMGYGDAVIMAITNDGEIPATCVVKVAHPKYKLTYMVDGEDYKTYDVEWNSFITPEAAPTKDGYNFSGWSQIPAMMPDHDVTITGSFTKATYKMTYWVDGVEYQTDEYDAGENVSLIAAPEKEGRVFVGWSLVMPANDVTLTAVYAPATSIDAIRPESSSFQIVTPDGIRRSVLQPGVNILRYLDGTERKVLVK